LNATLYDTVLSNYNVQKNKIFSDNEIFYIYREPLAKPIDAGCEERVWRVYYTYKGKTYMRHFPNEKTAIKAQLEAVAWDGFEDVGYDD